MCKKINFMDKKERYELLKEELSKIEDKSSNLAILLIDTIHEMEEKYPELTESEDENIRKELISLFQDCIDRINHPYYESDSRRWIAWLEKQGMEKSADEKVYSRTLDEAITLYYSSYAHDGKFNISLEKFRDIVKTLVKDYAKKPWKPSMLYIDSLNLALQGGKGIDCHTYEILKSLRDDLNKLVDE